MASAPASHRNRYVFGLIGAPCDPSPTARSSRVVARVCIDPGSEEKSTEARAADHLPGVQHDIDTMRHFFGRGQNISELFCYNHVDARGKQWLVTKLHEEFAKTDVRAYFVYYSGHGCKDNGAWYLGGQDTLAPCELFKLWQDSLSGQSGDSVLIIISDSCFSGHWVEAAKQAQLSSVAVQSATDQCNVSYDSKETGGTFTYRVYNRGSLAFQSVFSVLGYLSAVYTGLWIVFKETVGLFWSKNEGELFPQIYVPDKFKEIMCRHGGTIQPSKVINNGKFLFVDTFEWIIFR